MPALSDSYSVSAAMTNDHDKIHRIKAILIIAKPGIILAETLAGLAGILLSSVPLPSIKETACGIICITLAATGAAMANSILDRDTDNKMPRLRQRCLAVESIGPKRIAALSIALLSISLLAACNFLTATLLIAAAATYLLLYTVWLKKCSPWGVFAGAIPGALPPLIGSASVIETISAPAFLLAVLIFVWQLPHFWFLALHYRDEYQKAHIPVLPICYGYKITIKLIYISVSLLLPISLVLWPLGYSSGIYGIMAFIAWGAFVTLGYNHSNTKHNFRKGYLASIAYLVMILLAIIVDRYVGSLEIILK
ncbi:protoheme IX farnesyltransferase [Geobacter sp. OR-1]|uniref:heme o synthase n=1 Tax=Geobacter sp. OR-1 TaxID=1266765 RepID=UPI0005439605|nr:heme o synthase [Geobacter sp. OR-1]GAM11643.1 protoheme IX farnesyltransferase [Geobacter sp. OR-1]